MNTTLNVSLPEGLKDYVLKRVEQDDFANASDFIRHLIRQDRDRSLLADLEMKLAEGLDDDDAPLDAEEYRAIREEGMARLRKA